MMLSKEDLWERLGQLAEQVENAHHHAETEFELPRYSDPTFGRSKDGKNWHEPYRPIEIANMILRFREEICAEG